MPGDMTHCQKSDYMVKDMYNIHRFHEGFLKSMKLFKDRIPKV